MRHHPLLREHSLRFIPEGNDFVVVFDVDSHTSFQIKQKTREITDLAHAILAANSKYIDSELIDFARHISSRQPARFPALSSEPPEITITNDNECAQVLRVRDAIAMCLSFIDGVFDIVLERFEGEARNRGRDNDTERVM